MAKEYKISTLEGVDAVRKMPSMYIGNIEDYLGLHGILREVLDNAVDEFMAGHCNKIVVTLHKDGSVEVTDNGRGIPIYYMESHKKTALEVVFTVLHSSGKYTKGVDENYNYSTGLHGLGVSITNALSSKLKVISHRENKEASIIFTKGKTTEEYKEKPYKGPTGTSVRFAADPEIFKKNVCFDSKITLQKLKEISYLCQGLAITFIDVKNNIKEELSSESNISQFVKDLAEKKLLDEPIYFQDKKDNIQVEAALMWLEEPTEMEITKCYTNNIFNSDGGTHLIGFKSGITRTINSYIEKSDLPKTMKISLSGEDVREGLISIVSIKHPDPKFNSQDKVKLVSDDARAVVENSVSYHLLTYLEKNSMIAKKIITNCINSYKAREAAKKAREAIRKTALKDGIGVLPGKLADCSSKDPDECELFIVEGSSAGGSAKQGRDRHFQAILPLRGKVLNVEKTEFSKVLKNEELFNLMTVIGCGIGKGFDINKLRYNKIIIMTDSDNDGRHITILLLTFFFRQMPQLIMNGNIYIASPPLYRLSHRNNIYYLRDDKELKIFLKEHKIENTFGKLQRFKGLGELQSEQLWDTAMDPNKRTLYKVNIENPLEADKYFSILMGTQVEQRYNFIMENCKFVKAGR